MENITKQLEEIAKEHGVDYVLENMEELLEDIKDIIEEELMENYSNDYSTEIADIEAVISGSYWEMTSKEKADISINDEGVYVRWCDSYFSDWDNAVDILKEDDRAVNAAFGGYIEIEDSPHLENLYDNATTDISSDRERYVFLLEELDLEQEAKDFINENISYYRQYFLDKVLDIKETTTKTVNKI